MRCFKYMHKCFMQLNSKKIVITGFVFLKMLLAYGQININLSYNNNSILYESAQGLNGFEFDVNYKSNRKSNYGVSFRFNKEITNKKTEVNLLKDIDEPNYSQMFDRRYYYNINDSDFRVKKFDARKSYIYFAISFKHLFEMKNRNYIGYSLGVNKLGEQSYIKADSVKMNYFNKNATLFQVMLGVNYQKEQRITNQFYLLFGANVSVSAMPLIIYDSYFISEPIISFNASLGIRYYFNKQNY